MLSIIKTYLNDFVNLFYPVNCQSCGKNLIRQEKLICTECLYLIPKTRFHLVKGNPVSKIFWGRVNIEHASAVFFFVKEGILQRLVHKLKYKGVKEIGFELGKFMGAELHESEFYKKIDCIIPVPLHKKREAKRGYNQSEWIARGLSVTLNTEVETGNLIRAVATETQTRKSRFERWENVEDIFRILHPEKLENRHILLVDDIITTGSTLEACATVLLQVEGVKVSVAALGYTQ